MKKIKVLLFGLMLSACGLFEDDKRKFPVINRNTLAGCWYEVVHLNSWGCEERCYTLGWKYYGLFGNPPDSMVEYLGTYTIQMGGNYIVPNYAYKTYYDTATKYEYGGSSMTIIRDTLFTVVNNQLNNSKFIRSDSIYNCGPHWKYFIKPSDWDSL